MSASKEKRIRESDEAKKTRRKTNGMIIAIAVIVVALLAISLTINSKAIRRNGTAIKIDGVEFSVSEFNYYYFNSYYNYVNQVYTSYSDYADSMLPESGKPLKSQVYDEESGETWADFFEGIALDSLKEVAGSYKEATETGFEMTEEQLQTIQDEYDNTEDSAFSYGFSSFKDYLESYYGKGMNEDTFYDVLYRMYYANFYSQSVKEGFTYTDEELASYYDENSDQMDTYTYRYFYIAADTVDETEYENDEDGLTAAQEHAMADAKEKADTYANNINSEEDMIEAARDFDSETYAEDDATLRHYAGNILGSVYGVWLREAGRQEGDVYVAELENKGYYVVYFVNRDKNEYPVVNVHMITLNAETVSEDDYADDYDAYEAAQLEALEAVKNEADELFKTWKNDSDHSVENFVTYFTENSDNTSTEDGYIENMYMYQYTDEMDAWLFNSSRKEGDVALFANDEEDTYYLIYFDSTGMNYCDYLADTDLRDADYNEWLENLTGNMDINKTWLFSLTR